MNICKLLCIIMIAFICDRLSAQSDFDGFWTGTLEVGGMEMHMDFEMKSEERLLLLSVPIQNLNDVKSSSFIMKGDTLEAMFNVFNARYYAVYNKTTEAFEGSWTQGQNFDLILKRAEQKTEFRRPQTPKEPFPYSEEELKISNDLASISLSATLTTPEGDGPFPLAVLVSGSGPQDRNSTLLGHEPFLVIADYLARAGIAVIRYDDRGVGKSTGIHMKSTSKDFASDTRAVVEYAKSLPNIEHSKIGIIGHSEGGMIAPMVASEYSDLGFIVSLAGAALPIADLMTDQNVLILEKAGMTNEGLVTTKDNLPKIYSIVNQDKEPKELFDTLIKSVHGYYDMLSEEDQQLLAPNKASYYTQLAQSFFSPWFRYFLAYDPTDSWQNVKCPVLALNGSEDIQVEANSNIDAIKSNLKIAENEDVSIEIIEGLNHLFQPCETCTISEYMTIETTFDESILKKIESFILGLD